MSITAIWAIIRSLPWKWIGLGLALVSVVLFIDHRGYQRGFHKRDAEVAALAGTIANMKAASAQAAAQNLAHVRDVETRDAAIQKEQTDALDRQLVDARAATARYVSLHRAQTAPGNAGAGGVSQAAPASGPTDGAAQETVVPASDLEACADSFVIATGWQEWWARVSTSTSPPQP